MKRHGSERRRRWFLIAFAASAWLFFLNGLASMGQAFADGGIGPDASHVAAVGGTVALWTLLVSIVRLRFLQFCVALLAGLGLNAALHSVGFRELAALGVWTVGCDAGDGTACHNAAAFYDDGGAAFGGALDATRLHKRACALGGPDTEWSCVIAREFAVDQQRGDAMRGCLHGATSQCTRVARAFEDAGDLAQAYDWYRRACTLSKFGDELTPCQILVDSGFVAERELACERLDDMCQLDSSHRCLMLSTRCERARSATAGVD